MTAIRTATITVLAAGLALVAGACSGSGTAPTARRQRAHDDIASATPSRPATSTTTTTVTRPTAATDRMVPVGEGGARMHLACSGAGPTTVLLLSGFEDDGGSWGAVTPAVAPEARICAPARFGTGSSDAPPTVQTFTSQAGDLHDALAAAGEPGPYVVVGHSFGGVEAVAFASRFADEVRGVLLIDASPVDWPTVVCAVPDDGSVIAAGFRQTCDSITDASHNRERLDGERAFAELAAIAEPGKLGGLPMVVLTRAEVRYDGLDAGAQASLAGAWQAGQARWAGMSSVGEVVEVPDTSHYVQVDQPEVVADRLLALVS